MCVAVGGVTGHRWTIVCWLCTGFGRTFTGIRSHQQQSHSFPSETKQWQRLLICLGLAAPTSIDANHHQGLRTSVRRTLHFIPDVFLLIIQPLSFQRSFVFQSSLLFQPTWRREPTSLWYAQSTEWVSGFGRKESFVNSWIYRKNQNKLYDLQKCWALFHVTVKVNWIGWLSKRNSC